MLERWKPLFYRQTDEPEYHDEAEVKVANYRSTHQTASFVLTADAGRDPQGGGVRPRNTLKLKNIYRDLHFFRKQPQKCMFGTNLDELFNFFNGINC
jgi:hypothetical protein